MLIKPQGSTLKELRDRYKSPQNCKFLCVSKVKLKLWDDLPRNTKKKDLGLQEGQLSLV